MNRVKVLVALIIYHIIGKIRLVDKQRNTIKLLLFLRNQVNRLYINPFREIYINQQFWISNKRKTVPFIILAQSL